MDIDTILFYGVGGLLLTIAAFSLYTAGFQRGEQSAFDYRDSLERMTPAEKIRAALKRAGF
jgi:hypothetical protein